MSDPSRQPPRTALNGVLDVETLVLEAVAAYAAQAARALRLESLPVHPARVEANLRSLEALTVNGRAANAWAPLSGFFPAAAGGWVRTHTNSPWHRARLLRALGLPQHADASDLGRELLSRDAHDIEALADAAGALAVRVREPAESPTLLGAAAAPLWLGEPTVPRTSREPLRVLDLSTVIAGPTAGRALAAIGADVLRVDHPARPELPDLFTDTSAGKRSLALDANERGPELRALAASADIVLLGSRPGALDRFGLGSAELRDRHPDLITVSVRAYPADSPWANRRGFDSLVQAVSGISRVEGSAPGRPGALRAQALDHSTGYLLAAAALAARSGVPLPALSGLPVASVPTRGFELSLAGVARALLSRPKPSAPSPEVAPIPPAETESVTGPQGQIRRVRAMLDIPGRVQGPVPESGSDPGGW